MPEAALDLLRLDLEVADRGLELRVPVHQPLVAVDQAFVVEVDEHFQHRAGEVRVHRELLARPVHRAAEPAQLAGDGAAALGLPLPHLVDEILARIVGALVLLRSRAGARPPSGSRSRRGRCRPPTAHPCRAAARSGPPRPAACCRARGRYAAQPVTLGGGLTMVNGARIGPFRAEQPASPPNGRTIWLRSLRGRTSCRAGSSYGCGPLRASLLHAEGLAHSVRPKAIACRRQRFARIDLPRCANGPTSPVEEGTGRRGEAGADRPARRSPSIGRARPETFATYDGGRSTRIDLSGNRAKIDTVGAWTVWSVRHATAAPRSSAPTSRPQRLIETVKSSASDAEIEPAARSADRARARRASASWSTGWGQGTLRVVGFLGAGSSPWPRFAHPPIERGSRARGWCRQMELVGVSALGIVGLMSFLIGIVIAQQGAAQLAPVRRRDLHHQPHRAGWRCASSAC